jgi:glutathione S-transferase
MPVKLYSAKICPFAQRSRMALLEKGIDFELIEVDLDNKSAEFLAVSPYGRVPALINGDDQVYESSVINEYLEETYPEPHLMPTEPALRAQIRLWTDYCNTTFLPHYYDLLTERDEVKAAALKARLDEKYRFMETEGFARLSGEGPYWLGAKVSLLDLTYYPFFDRLVVWKHYRGVTIPDDCPRLARWHGVMTERASAKATAESDAYFIEQYAGYANADTSAWSPAADSD